ncbi:MAG: HD domain-containing protein [Spirochaetales bacterium]|nr:HD domain-containing protein [Spirochaetales bacterium]
MKKSGKYMKDSSSSTALYLEHHIQYWRQRICDAIFLFFSIFGLIAYIPSAYFAWRDNLPEIIILDTVAYLLILFTALFKPLNYMIKALIGSIVFYGLGVVLLVLLGPTGVGNLWLFAFSLMTSLILGTKASLISLLINIVSQGTILFLVTGGYLPECGEISSNVNILFVRAINFIVLNIVIVVANFIYVSGFTTMLAHSEETRKATIVGLAKLAEYRDTDTGEHLLRIQAFTELLARRMMEKKIHDGYISEAYIQDLGLSSILHDIGKVGISDSILLKKAPLTEEEFEKIKKHPLLGEDVIKEIDKNISGRSLYQLGKEIAGHHHEKWDGSGYPDGLKGIEIPLSARIVALVDVYDALTSERPYKKAFPHKKALEIILEGKGTHFDPQITDVFLESSDDFKNS